MGAPEARGAKTNHVFKTTRIVHAITVKLKIGLLDEALNRHMQHLLTIEQLVAPPLLIC